MKPRLPAPRCRALGPQCQAVKVTLRIGDLEQESASERDALATWLTGHTERISFGEPYPKDGRLVVDATIYVPCKYLQTDGTRSTASCLAHGYRGPTPRAPAGPPQPRFRHDQDRFSIVYHGKRRVVALRPRPSRAHPLPVIHHNPCVGAPCRTADNKRGAACCRDLTLDVLDNPGDDALEALLRSRRSPYLCKVSRESSDLIECEVISACGYLDEDGVGCTLHERLRPDGQPAKPFVCTEWPNLDPDHTGHPGCRLL